MKINLISAALLVCLTCLGCSKYQRGDKVELLDGRICLVKKEYSDGMYVDIIVLNDKGLPLHNDVIDILEIKRKITPVEKE